MLSKSPGQRPNMPAVLGHPFWWSEEQRLQFLVDVSDRWVSRLAAADYWVGEQAGSSRPLRQAVTSLALPSGISCCPIWGATYSNHHGNQQLHNDQLVCTSSVPFSGGRLQETIYDSQPRI